MNKYILILTILSMFACGKMKNSRSKAVESNQENDIESVDSLAIKNLVSNYNVYIKHKLVDFDNDKNFELLIISESNQKSECLSMWDTSCVFVNIDLYKLRNKEWELLKKYKINDSRNTFIKIDSTLNLVISQYSTPSGLSKQNKVQFYSFRDGDFYLQKIDLKVDSKINSRQGIDKNSWKYLIDFESKKIRLDYSELRMNNHLNGEPELESVDTTIYKKLNNYINLKLGQSYEIDSLLIRGYQIFY